MMARGKKKESALTPEEKLAQALVPDWGRPYKVPKNWCWTRTGSIAEVASGGTPSSSIAEYYENGDIPWISPADLSGYNAIYIDGGAKNITTLGLEKSSARLLPKDTVCLSSRAPIGYVAIASNPLCTNQGFKNFLPSDCYLPKYLYWYLKGNKELLESYASGTTFLELSGSKAAMVEIPLAPITEQQRIVDRIEYLFSKLDEAKEKAQLVLDSFETRKAAILHKAFTGELTAKWRAEQRVSFETWKRSPLAEIATVVSGYAFSSKDFCEENTVPCIKITNVGVGEYVADDYEFLPESYLEEYERFAVKKGDILISLTRSFINAGLKVCICEEERVSLLNQRVALIKDCNIGYIFYYLRSDDVLRYVKEKSKTTNQPNLSIKDLNSMLIAVPCADEQTEIVRILDSLFAKEQQAKEAAEAVLDKIDLLKKSILARAFRGELGTNDPSEESALELLKCIL